MATRKKTSARRSVTPGQEAQIQAQIDAGVSVPVRATKKKVAKKKAKKKTRRRGIRRDVVMGAVIESPVNRPASKRVSKKKRVTKKKRATKKKAGKRASQRGLTSFPLMKLLNLSPCYPGLYDALHLLRRHDAIQVPQRRARAFWAAVEDMQYGPRLDASRRRVREMADDVRIVIRPDIFAETIATNHNFSEYSRRILGKRGMGILRGLLVEIPELAAAWRQEGEVRLQNRRDNLRRAQEQLRERTRELEQVIAARRREVEELERGMTRARPRGSITDIDIRNIMGHHELSVRRAAGRAVMEAMRQSLS